LPVTPPLPEVPADERRQAVERLHGGRARLREAVHLVEHFRGQVAWEGAVHVFDLEGHPKATVCYAWTSPVGEGDQRRFYAVLGAPPINSAADAVRASIVANQKSKRLS
jgi:hypothetical protein